MTNQIYYQIKKINKRQESDKWHRERLQQMNSIREQERNRVLEELQKKIDIRSKNVGIGDIIEVSEIYFIIEEIRNEKKKPRKFN